MTDAEVAARHTELCRRLITANKQYYCDGRSNMSDYSYDLFMSELEGIEREFPGLVNPDSPTQFVGSDVLTSYESNRYYEKDGAE